MVMLLLCFALFYWLFDFCCGVDCYVSWNCMVPCDGLVTVAYRLRLCCVDGWFVVDLRDLWCLLVGCCGVCL